MAAAPFAVIGWLCCIALNVLYLYAFWTNIRESFSYLFNPLIHLATLLSLLLLPAFWFLFLLGGGGLLIAYLLTRNAADRELVMEEELGEDAPEDGDDDDWMDTGDAHRQKPA